MDDQQISVPELPPYGQDVQEDIESDPASENDVGRVRHYTQTPWSVRFDQLVAFKQEFGNTNVPKRYSDKQLAKWVSKQRQLYKSQKLLQERIDKLNEIGFVWSLGNWRPGLNNISNYSEKWDENYNNLIQYNQQFGDTNVPTRYSDKGLANWVRLQRSRYKKNIVSEEHIFKLERIGFNWSLKDGVDVSWDQYYNQLLEYIAEKGDCNVSRYYAENESLGKWVGYQRTNYRLGKLTEEKIAKLNEAGFTWSINTSFKTHFDELVQYKQTHGDCNVPYDSTEYGELVLWVKKIRGKHKGRLSEEQKAMLDGIGFTWYKRCAPKRETSAPKRKKRTSASSGTTAAADYDAVNESSLTAGKSPRLKSKCTGSPSATVTKSNTRGKSISIRTGADTVDTMCTSGHTNKTASRPAAHQDMVGTSIAATSRKSASAASVVAASSQSSSTGAAAAATAADRSES